MKSIIREGISSFAWQSLNDNLDESGHKRRQLQRSSLQVDVDSIDNSSDSCHSDNGSSVILNKRRKCSVATTGHNFMPTPYDKVLAESISEFEPSSQSEDDGCHDTDDDPDDHHDIHDDVNGGVGYDGDDELLEHNCNISDSQSISSIASSPDVSTANQIMTSEWLKGVVMTTPNSKVTTPVKGSSSGRGSKAPRRRISFVRCGLAEQLDHLLSRQRSEKALWHHQMLRQQDKQAVPNGSLAIKIVNSVTSHSLFVAQAHVIREAGPGRPHKGESITVLFDDDTVKVLKLQSGSFVLICPPWQALMIGGSRLVLLSTHFCLPFCHDEDDYCSDSADISIRDDLDQHPVEPVSIVRAIEDKEQQVGMTPQGSTREDDTHKHKLTPLLEAIEQAHYGLVAMTAKLQRVYRRKFSYRVAKQFSSSSLTHDFIQSARNYHQDGSSIRWFFLLEDNEGVWSEVIVDNEQVVCSKEWKCLVVDGEGSWYRFTDLRVTARSTKTNNPGTFSLISSLLEMKESAKVVKFCYQLFATATTSARQMESEVAAPSAWSHVITQDLSQPHPQRVTIFGMVIYCSAEVDNSWLLLATSSSSNKAITAIIKPGCVLDYHLATANGSYLWIQDAASMPESNVVCCDGCTFVVSTDRHGNPLKDVLCPRVSCDPGEVSQPCVVELTEANCRVGEIVHVKGTVVAVDEDNATYLPLCSTCGGHLIEPKESDELYCDQCQVTVSNPGITVELAVYMVTTGLAQVTLHIQLQKTTAAKLLPVDYCTAEEGLDVNRVLNQTLLLQACHISTIDDTIVYMQEVQWDWSAA